MSEALWHRWQEQWRWMESIAKSRGWELRPLEIAAPATDAQLRRLERAAGMEIPSQLREVLSRFSARVAFDWNIPSHLQPMEQSCFPTSSANRGAIWDIAHIEAAAIPNFRGWKKMLAEEERSEAPNSPEMWEKQFPFYELVNGDMLVIDMAQTDGSQPVRYFSHELEVPHGQALAPDFFTFISEMAALGHAGTEAAGWMLFSERDGETSYLKADSKGGRQWRDWLQRDPGFVGADEPPPSIVEGTVSERALLVAARNNDETGVLAALEAGARIDVTWNKRWLSGNWSEEFSTAVSYATRHNNIALLEKLVERGAALNTRRLAMADAVEFSSLDTVRWLTSHGARVDGWKDQRYWPIHLLITKRFKKAGRTAEVGKDPVHEVEWALNAEKLGAETVARLKESLRGALLNQRAADIGREISIEDCLAMLRTLLEAGADPDARWDNGTTMLMWAGPEAMKLLLRHGADVHARDTSGWTALHYARGPEDIRILVAAGADINAVARPAQRSDSGLFHTPLQAALLGSFRPDVVHTLLELGADPKVRDLDGRSTLCYCTEVESFRLMMTYGLDPLEGLPDGGTQLHNLLKMKGAIRAAFPAEVEMLDLLLSLDLDINATDATGRTMLHLSAGLQELYRNPEDMKLLLDRGADTSIRDRRGKVAADLVPRSLKEIRELLR